MEYWVFHHSHKSAAKGECPDNSSPDEILGSNTEISKSQADLKSLDDYQRRQGEFPQSRFLEHSESMRSSAFSERPHNFDRPPLALCRHHKRPIYSPILELQP